MKGLLLAGGYGTRLRPLTFTGNKHMIPIANQPMLFYGLHHLHEAGIAEVAVVLGPLHEGIPEAIGDGSGFGLRVTYIHQGEPKGLAHAVLCAREFLGDDPFVMYLGDNLLQEGARPLTRAFAEHGGAAVIGVTPVADPRQYGVVEMEGDRIVSIVEKPPKPRSPLALIGVYLFTAAIHPIIASLKPSARGELEITEAIWEMHRRGMDVRVQRVQGWWKDTGRPGDLIEANEMVLRSMPPSSFAREGEIDPRAQLEGLVAVGKGTTIESGVRIHGPVVIGRDATLRTGTQIGPATAIGDGAVLEGIQVHRSIVLERARLSGGFRLEDSIVGRSVEIQGPPADRRVLSCILGDAAKVRLLDERP